MEEERKKEIKERTNGRDKERKNKEREREK